MYEREKVGSRSGLEVPALFNWNETGDRNFSPQPVADIMVVCTTRTNEVTIDGVESPHFHAFDGNPFEPSLVACVGAVWDNGIRELPKAEKDNKVGSWRLRSRHKALHSKL